MANFGEDFSSLALWLRTHSVQAALEADTNPLTNPEGFITLGSSSWPRIEYPGNGGDATDPEKARFCGDEIQSCAFNEVQTTISFTMLSDSYGVCW